MFAYTTQLHQVIEVQQQIQHLHPFLEKLYPIAIVQGEQFLIYDIDATGEYTFVKQAPTPMPIPVGIRAAFPLECYDGRMACVVTDDVFENLAEIVIVFHEFVHCQQFESCEPALKAMLDVAQKAQSANDPMWEINHPFPYDNADFTRLYTTILQSDDLDEITVCHRQLKALLDVHDYEYLIWQEWKEGFARYLENRMKQALGLPLNLGGMDAPFSRVSLYAGGAHTIEVLAALEPEIVLDIERLFERMITNVSSPTD